MLHFACRPDPVFTELLDDAFDLTIDMLREETCDLHPFPDEVVRLFGGTRAVQEALVALRAASRQQSVFEINDYHMLLLYYLLDSYCEVYNDTVRMEDEDGDGEWQPILAHGEPVRAVDFGTLGDVFFPDLDFLFTMNLLDPRIPQQALDMVGFRETTAGVLAQMKPHPDELRLVPLDEAPDWYSDTPNWWRPEQNL